MQELPPQFRHLGSLNSQDWFCHCGQGPADNCPAHHVKNELHTPGSNTRSLLILGIILLVAVALVTQIR